MEETSGKVSFLEAKDKIQSPFEWVLLFSVGLMNREEYEKMGFAGATPIHMIGTNTDALFPTYKITAENLSDLRLALVKSMERFFDQVSQQPAVTPQDSDKSKK